MEHFVDEGGKYVFRGGQFTTQRRILTAVILISGLTALVASLIMYLTMRKHGALEHNSYLPLVPLFSLPGTLVVLLFLRRRIGIAGTVTVDYMNGSMTYGLRKGNGYRTADLQTSHIRRIIVSKASSVSLRGTPTVLWTVSIESQSGVHPVMKDRSEPRARGFAAELGSLISCSVDDGSVQ